MPSKAWATPSSLFVTCPMVKERGGTVLFECQPSLVKLLSGMAGIDQLIPAGALLPPFDVHVPLLDLPSIFGTTLATIPAAVPYLHADAGRLQYWRQELEALPGFKVGIVWQGNPKNTGDRYRSIPLTHFASLAGIPGIRLLSLQVGPGVEQLAKATFPIIDLGNRFDPGSLDDLAAVLKHLHLVIAADTAVAHLAGALAIPAWVLIPVTPDWRWLRERTDSPWYPTIRLFRQSRPEPGTTSSNASTKDYCSNVVPPGTSTWESSTCARGSPPRRSRVIARRCGSTPIMPRRTTTLATPSRARGYRRKLSNVIARHCACDPRNSHAHYNLGNALKNQGEMTEAAYCYRQALAVNPRHAEAHNNLGVILKDQGQPAEAAECFRRALAINPDDANTHYNLGSVLKDQEQFAEAAVCYRQVLRITPRHADAHHYLSIVLTRSGLIEEALEHIEQALRINPAHATALWQRSLLRLLMGDFTGGWQDYEQRWRSLTSRRALSRGRAGTAPPSKVKPSSYMPSRAMATPSSSCAFLPMVKKRGGTVFFECQTSPGRLLAGIAGVDHPSPPARRCRLTMCKCLCLVCRPFLARHWLYHPRGRPVLAPTPSLVERWRRRLAQRARLKLGIAWQGSIEHPATATAPFP